VSILILVIAIGSAGFFYTNWNIISFISIYQSQLEAMNKQNDHLNHLTLEILGLKNPCGMMMSGNLTDSKYKVKQIGQSGTSDYMVYFYKDRPISPWHDIPLYPNPDDLTIVNMIVEIPKNTRAKNEVYTQGKLNPIKQDIVNGAVRYFKYPYAYNYGAIPQTWENPEELDPYSSLYGDSDPLDIIDIGSIPLWAGAVIPVKVIGIIPLIDREEADYKVVAININDPLANRYNDTGDLGDQAREILEWFTYYKYPDIMTIGLNSTIQNKKFALKIISNLQAQWNKLITGEIQSDDYAVRCSLCPSNVKPQYKLSKSESNDIVNQSWQDYIKNI